MEILKLRVQILALKIEHMFLTAVIWVLRAFTQN